MVAHPAILRGVELARGPAGGKTFPPTQLPPTILGRTDQDFLGAVLANLSTEPGWQALAQSEVRAPQSIALKLFQPVHRTFHVALLEVVCDRPELPRLDPRRIENAGLVVRRCSPQLKVRHGWMNDRNRIVGWVPFLNEAQELADPESQRRRDALTRLPAALRARLPISDSPWDHFSESVTSLFVAPPAICQAAGRTLLYGLIPVTSSEQSEGGAPLKYELDFVEDQLPALVRATKTKSGLTIVQDIPVPRKRLVAANANDKELEAFIEVLKQLLIEFDALDHFKGGPRTPGRVLFEAINQISLRFTAENRVLTTRPAGEFLRDAAYVLINRNKDSALGADSVVMPDAWPEVGGQVGQNILNAAKDALESRIAAVSPAQSRFEEPDPNTPQTYCLRAFVRVKREDGCPSEILWSTESAPFTIAPWFENGALPPVRIQLPPLDRNLVRKLKPNAAFVVPGKIFEFLRQNDPLKLLKGEGEEGKNSTLNWICGFNIPIITLCAFIVLSIFLALLHIVFWWLPFVRICLPLPTKKGG